MKNRSKLFFLSCIVVFFNVGCGEETDKYKEEDNTRTIFNLTKKTQSARTEVYSPEEELAGFTVPDGFVIELVASEKDGIVNPIDLTFDDSGRLWTQTAKMYPLDPVAGIPFREVMKLIEDPVAQQKNPNFKRISDLYKGNIKGDDKILVLSGLYDNAVKVNTWADGLAIPQSILPYKNGSYVAQGSELFFLSDTNNDGKADTRTPMFTGFGYTDTHTMAHTMKRGPGDWIHFSHGALNKGEVSSLVSDAKTRIDYSKIARFSLDAKKIEIVSSGLNNIWGFQMRNNGQWFGCEANDKGYSVAPMEVGTGFSGIGGQRIRPYQPWMPEVHSFRVGGTGISGLAFVEDTAGSFPEEWKNVAFLANPISSTINAVRIIRNPDGTVSSEHLPDFLSSEDDWFRPVNMEFGPDGSLYIADWYNKIVSHNEVSTTHPDRDKSHGRIWRIRHKSQQPVKIPDFYKLKTNELVGYLKSPSFWAKQAAWHQITDRPIEETKILANDLIALAADKNQDEVTRIAALWSLEGIKHYNEALMMDLLNSTEDNLRREAVRALVSFSLSAENLAKLLKKPSVDTNVMVRSQVLRTLDQAAVANTEIIALLVDACKPPLEGNALGGAYERNFERYLARKALELYPKELYAFMNSSKAGEYDVSNLIWASQALPQQEKERTFLSLWKKADYKELDKANFIIVSEMLGNKAISKAVEPVLHQKNKAATHVSFVLNNIGRMQSDELTRLLTKPIQDLLESDDVLEQNLGLEAVGKLKINTLKNKVVHLANDKSSEKTLGLVLRAIKNQPKDNKEVLKQLFDNEKLSIRLRASALEGLSKANMGEAVAGLKSWAANLDERELRAITKEISGSKAGAELLKKSYKDGVLKGNAFDISSAEKVLQINAKNETGIALMKDVEHRLNEERKGFEAKLKKYMTLAEKGGGDPKAGENLFQICLQCHSVGNKGYEFAPALDGSAMRENEALLTAILDPDAAMEASYAVYSVTNKDGTKAEGYLVKKDDRGTTLGFIGGGEMFIQSKDIMKQGFIGGRSFMIKGLIDGYTDEQVSNLLAYIKTLK
ncbi:c-type cytochrome [Algibacter miyuki]|uniref:C-type cytochrome n=1 Tax=Algibacter miyuki TaxID=1306933 RepID=A0ABV5H0C7_9FLAO|nr:c-type cytochrome [Algibacter miyuki]MDN3667413.1 c-type cytochrome [Algibacter miyuki]